MKLVEIMRRFRRLDILDVAMVKLVCVIIGVVIATYFLSLRGFVEQNLLVVVFLLILIGIRPMIRYLK